MGPGCDRRSGGMDLVIDATAPDRLPATVPDPSRLIEDTRVHRAIYVDPGIFAAEMSRIFMRMWVYVGHDSEVASQGDVKATAVGVEPVVLVRDGEGTARVFVNRCPEGGAPVCRGTKGSATALRCACHGWSFGLDGRAESGGAELTAAPRVESYRGFLFASFDADVPALTEHLRDVLPYIDRFVDQIDGYELRVAPDAHETYVHANWKLPLENSVDGYHLSFTHQSVFAVMEKRTGKRGRYLTARNEKDASTEAFANGHGVMDLRAIAPEVMRNRLDTMPGAPPPGADLDAYFGIDGGEAVYLSTPGTGMNITVFPNLQLGSANICEVHPVSVNRTRIVLRPLLLDGAPDALNRMRLRYHEIGSGPAGFVQPDDLEMFERVQEGLAAARVEWIQLSRGVAREEVGAGEHRTGHLTDEVPQRGQYRWWRRLMSVG